MNSTTEIEPLAKANIGPVAKLYCKRCNYLKLGSVRVISEYLRRHIESRNHLHGYVIKKSGKVVGASYMVKAGAKEGILLFTVTDEKFTGPERMIAFGRAYRETNKALIAKGINSVQSSADKNNAAIIGYSVGTGYIKFAETDLKVYFEIYLSLLASVISNLSGISLDEISLLKLANIAANPKEDGDSSYIFDFDFKDRHYALMVDKLSHEMESLSCPEFSIGFTYSKPTGWTSERLKAFFDVSNSTDRPQEIRFVLELVESNSCKRILKEFRGHNTYFDCNVT